ncbi:MAG: redoxin domain-containing protein [Blautia sp.]|nr:redoxin domain-containing protein [Blautia sp.]
MKAKKVLITLLALGTALSFTACNGETTEKETAKTESAKTESSKTETTNTETTEADKTETVKAGTENTETENTGSDTAQITYEETDTDPSDNASDPELDNLYQQENQLFADHKDAWDKAFGLMSKSSADSSGNYADFLSDTVESNKDSFTDEQYQTLTDDIETIRKIEEQIAELEKKNAETDTSETKTASDDASPFNNFSGKDFDGNSVDESLFSKNAVTVVNFWFTGCKPCVAELSKLNELNDAIKSMGGEVVGINTETFDGNEDAIKEAASILESQGAKYRNLSIDSDSDAGKYASSIMAFPTTILVDRNGNIVGDPMLGGIDNQDNYDALMKQIQSVIDADSTEK